MFDSRERAPPLQLTLYSDVSPQPPLITIVPYVDSLFVLPPSFASQFDWLIAILCH